MKIIGVSPNAFSGFETSFFEAVGKHGAEIERIVVELPYFKMWSVVSSFHFNKSRWGPRYSHKYYTSISAFKKKSTYVQRQVKLLQKDAHAIYQIGSLCDPIGSNLDLPLFLQLDYTSKLSKKRKGGWTINEGDEEQFWIEQELNLYNKAAIICTTTENARQSIINDYGIDSEKIITVNAGVSPPYDKLNSGKFPDYNSKNILFIGKGDTGKGLDTVLDAFKMVKKSIPDARLTIVGPVGISINEDGVDFRGRIADKNIIRNLYYDHALFVMPSRFEPFGQVFLEAMASHLPCIGTTVDAMPEIIDHGVTGYNIEPGDHVTLAEYMMTILNNPDLARQMGEAGFGRLRERYIWPIVGKKIFDIINNNSKDI